MLKQYQNWAPTPQDVRGLSCDDRQDWYVAPVIRTRDSLALERANFDAAYRSLVAVDLQGEDHEVHRFGHWGPGWYEIILVRPNSRAYHEAVRLQASLQDYCALDEDLWSEYEWSDANEAWKHCYNDRQRIEYIRENRRDFEFHDFADLLGCVRGQYFCGDTTRMAGP